MDTHSPSNFDAQLDELGQSLRMQTPSRGLDLSELGLSDYLQRQSPLIRQVLDGMEREEPWASDRDWDAVDALHALGRQLQQSDYEHLGQSPSADLVRLLGMISMTRVLMIVDRIGTEGRVDDVQFLSLCKEISQSDPDTRRAYHLVLARLLFLNRRRLLHKIYSPTRAHQLSLALRAISVM